MDMVCPIIGVILYYITIFTTINFRYYLADWSSSVFGVEIAIYAVVYLMMILVVGLYCNMRPFNMWGLDKYNINQKESK